MKDEVKRPKEEKMKGKSEDLPYNPEVTNEDMQALNKKGRSMNKGQDKALDRDQPVDFSAGNMDIPNSNNAKVKDESQLVDEENMQFNAKGSRTDNEAAKDHPKSNKKI